MNSKTVLRNLISFASLTGFVGGWALLANTPEIKNQQAVSAPAGMTLEMPPIPDIDDMVGSAPTGQISNLQSFRVQVNASAPRMRTGGS